MKKNYIPNVLDYGNPNYYCNDQDEFEDKDNKSFYVTPDDIDTKYGKYYPNLLNEVSRFGESCNFQSFFDVHIVIHEVALLPEYNKKHEKIGRYRNDVGFNANSFIDKYNDLEKNPYHIGVHFVATKCGVVQLARMGELMFHAKAAVPNAIGNSKSIAIERDVDYDTYDAYAIYNQAKTAASIIMYYANIYNISNREDINKFINNNVITHSECQTALSEEEIVKGIDAGRMLINNRDSLKEEEIEKLEKIAYYPALSVNLDEREIKVCPARLLRGQFGGMKTLKSQIKKCIDRYLNGDKNALFECIVYNDEYIDNNHLDPLKTYTKGM